MTCDKLKNKKQFKEQENFKTKPRFTTESGELFVRIMEMEKIKNNLINWAKKKPFISKVYIFGSRARNNFNESSDLDVALVFDPVENDESSFVSWTFEAKNWNIEIQEFVPFKLDLQHYDGKNTPHIKSGIEESSILIYERT